MGTRSLTLVRDTEKSKDIIVLYRQYDGYPEGHGKDLSDFLADFAVVNGISSNTPKRAANGMGCLAAQIVAHFKTEIGNFYLYPSGTRDCGEEYIYTVYSEKKQGGLMLKVQAGAVTFFGLPGTKQDNMPVLYQGPLAEFDPEGAKTAYKKLAKDIPNDYLDAQKA
jgi:hypothetical protein